jgi:hypothetical protein
MTAFASGEFRKSTLSGPDGNCVEVARRPERIGVRDSKDPASPVLEFTAPEWHAFIEGVKAGEFDLR